MMVIRYEIPDRWVKYDGLALVSELTEAKAAVMSLTTIPYQRSWAEALQEMELRREVAGTSRIEGADFTERELDEALRDDTPAERLSRSQRQARSAKTAYRWIARLDDDRPIDGELIREVHRLIVTGCDDDHCPLGRLRGPDQNVTFGQPRHRGAMGGEECRAAFAGLCDALQGEFREHDSLIQALALHYHLAAMHPFLDGNGRTARALEALVLQRTGLKDDLFVAMSNYYYDEKTQYLSNLTQVRENNYDLTEFLKFGLKCIALQCKRLFGEIRRELTKSLYRDVMGKMYGRLLSTRKRALARRQLAILEILLEYENTIHLYDLFIRVHREYNSLKTPQKAYFRDLNYLDNLQAINVSSENKRYYFSIRLEWATEITETDFFGKINQLPEAKTKFLLRP